MEKLEKVEEELMKILVGIEVAAFRKRNTLDCRKVEEEESFVRLFLNKVLFQGFLESRCGNFGKFDYFRKMSFTILSKDRGSDRETLVIFDS